MSEVARFMRYVLPGLATIFLLIVSFAISDQDSVVCFYNKAVSNGGIAVMVGTFLASGALGYLLSLIYWALYWCRPFKKSVAGHDHRFLVNMEYKINIQGLKSGEPTPLKVKDIKERQAWEIVTQWLHSNPNPITSVPAFHKFNSRLVDMVHSLGTTLVGVILAFLGWLLFQVWNKCIMWTGMTFDWSYTLLLIVLFVGWIVMIVVTGFNFWNTRRTLVTIAHSTMANGIMEQFRRWPYDPVKIWYVDSKKMSSAK